MAGGLEKTRCLLACPPMVRKEVRPASIRTWNRTLCPVRCPPTGDEVQHGLAGFFRPTGRSATMAGSRRCPLLATILRLDSRGSMSRFTESVVEDAARARYACRHLGSNERFCGGVGQAQRVLHPEDGLLRVGTSPECVRAGVSGVLEGEKG